MQILSIFFVHGALISNNMKYYDARYGWRDSIEEGIIQDVKYKMRGVFNVFNKCISCNAAINDRTDSFMVNDNLWKSVFPKFDGKDGFIHWDCFEAKLGRLLTAQDFKQYSKYPINNRNTRIQQLSNT